uniref:MYND-type domain-containing protein n=4 Tax=Magallana gigas TaxID=29159 RepID=A0A8W8JPF1_MAGGI
EVLITQSPQQTKPNVHMNVNGKCIVCSKFALYLCSKCQLFWYCSPQCQLKHWVTHQHQCKNSSAVSKQSATDIIIMEN